MTKFLVLFMNLLIILNLVQLDQAASGIRNKKSGSQVKVNGTYEDSASSNSKV